MGSRPLFPSGEQPTIPTNRLIGHQPTIPTHRLIGYHVHSLTLLLQVGHCSKHMAHRFEGNQPRGLLHRAFR